VISLPPTLILVKLEQHERETKNDSNQY